MRCFQDASHRAGDAGKANRAASLTHPGETVDDSAKARAVELGYAREIEDDAGAVLAEKLVEGQLELLAFDTHLQRAAQLEDRNAGLHLFFGDSQSCLPYCCVVSNGIAIVKNPWPGINLRSGRILGRSHFLTLVRKLPNGSSAIGERVEQRIAPAGREKRRRPLIDVLIGLREKTRELPSRWRDEFLHGDDKANLTAVLILLDRKMMEECQLFGNILLSKSPIAHKFLRRGKQRRARKQCAWNTRILGCAVRQVNAAGGSLRDPREGLLSRTHFPFLRLKMHDLGFPFGSQAGEDFRSFQTGEGTHMKWITREHVKVDRVACPWLIRKFVDPAAEFYFVPAEQVMSEAQRLVATPFDVPAVELGHHGKECSFEAILNKYNLTGDAALVLLGKIVNGADTDNTLWHQPEGAGLNAIAEGFRHLNFRNDHEINAAEWIVYDALYAYCKEMVKRGKPEGAFR